MKVYYMIPFPESSENYEEKWKMNLQGNNVVLEISSYLWGRAVTGTGARAGFLGEGADYVLFLDLNAGYKLCAHLVKITKT